MNIYNITYLHLKHINSDVFKNLLIYSKFKGGAHVVKTVSSR